MSGYCGEDASVESTCRQFEFFGHDGSKLRGGRGDRGNSHDRGSSGLNRYLQKEYNGEEYNNNSNGVMGDGRDGCFSVFCGIDGNQWSGDGCDSHVGWYSRGRRQQGRRSHSRSSSIRIRGTPSRYAISVIVVSVPLTRTQVNAIKRALGRTIKI